MSTIPGMGELNGIYTQRFNRRHHRVGQRLRGRYKAALVEKNSYLLELSRYIVLNPVRADLCVRADDWRLSSHRALMGKTLRPSTNHYLNVDSTTTPVNDSRKGSSTRRMTSISFGNLHRSFSAPGSPITANTELLECRSIAAQS